MVDEQVRICGGQHIIGDLDSDTVDLLEGTIGGKVRSEDRLFSHLLWLRLIYKLENVDVKWNHI
jgi:hypothetical protein